MGNKKAKKKPWEKPATWKRFGTCCGCGGKGATLDPRFWVVTISARCPKEVIRLTLKQISSLDTRWSNCSLPLIWHARIQTTLRFTLRSQPVNIEFRRTWSRCRNLATSGGLSFMYQKTGRLKTSSHGTWLYIYMCVYVTYIHIYIYKYILYLISAYNAIAWICWRWSCFPMGLMWAVYYYDCFLFKYAVPSANPR